MFSHIYMKSTALTCLFIFISRDLSIVDAEIRREKCYRTVLLPWTAANTV